VTIVFVCAEAKDLIRNLLVVEPSRRFDAVQVLTHPWILTRGNTKRLDRNAVTELQTKTKGELEQKAFHLLRDYRDTVSHLESQFNQQQPPSFRPPA
jgi:serine/threonine protein kinase